MKRNCNLELQLLPPSASLPSGDHHHHRNLDYMFNGTPEEEKDQQQLTIFYSGRVSRCDVTEIQARAIILLATQEKEEKSKSPSPSPSLSLSPSPNPIGSDPVAVQSQMYSPISGLSMRRSLQRFLHKRKDRLQSTSPYHHRR